MPEPSNRPRMQVNKATSSQGRPLNGTNFLQRRSMNAVQISVNTLAIAMGMVVCAGILVVASVAVAGSHSEKLFLRCSGYSKLYEWQVDYKLVVNLDREQITDADGNIYETVKFNDGIIVIKRQFESYTANELSGQNPTPTEHSLELRISRIGLNFSAVEHKGGFKQKEITEGLLEVPSAKGSCSRVSGF